MNLRSVAIVSLTVNVALLALVWTGPGADRVRSPASDAAGPVGPSPRQGRAPLENPNQADSALESPTPFHWSQVATTDFATYRDRLRAIGCPDRTVRDILTAEINHHFELRRQEIVGRLQGQFWESLTRHPHGGKDVFDAELRPLKDERRELLEAVVGQLPQTDPGEERARERAEWDRQNYWLPAEKRQLLRDLEDRVRERFAEVERDLDKLPPKQRPAERQRRRAEIATEADARRQSTLSPEEWGEWQLRQSKGANWAAGADGFAPTEEEWRTVVQALNDFQTDTASSAGETLTAKARRARDQALRQGREDVLRSALGDERYAEYQRANDSDFQQLRRVAARLNLSESAAIDAYALRQAAVVELDRVQAQTDLSEDGRAAQRREVLARTSEALARTLGNAAYQAYLDNGGEWLVESPGK